MNAIVPSVPAQVVGFVAVPAVRVGAEGFVTILLVASEAMQPTLVIEKLLYVPSSKPVKEKALLLIVTILGPAVATEPV